MDTQKRVQIQMERERQKGLLPERLKDVTCCCESQPLSLSNTPQTHPYSYQTESVPTVEGVGLMARGLFG